MQTSSEQGQFMRLLIQLLDTCRILEIVVYTGYSSLSMAISFLRPGGLVLIDNVLWGGSVVDYSCDNEVTEAIR